MSNDATNGGDAASLTRRLPSPAIALTASLLVGLSACAAETGPTTVPTATAHDRGGLVGDTARGSAPGAEVPVPAVQ